MYLKCDEGDCDHMETVDEISETLIGKECPKCGANLLTAEDHAQFSTQVQPAMKIMEALGLAREALPGETGATRIGVHNGEVTMKSPSNTPQEQSK